MSYKLITIKKHFPLWKMLIHVFHQLNIGYRHYIPLHSDYLIMCCYVYVRGRGAWNQGSVLCSASVIHVLVIPVEMARSVRWTGQGLLRYMRERLLGWVFILFWRSEGWWHWSNYHSIHKEAGRGTNIILIFYVPIKKWIFRSCVPKHVFVWRQYMEKDPY